MTLFDFVVLGRSNSHLSMLFEGINQTFGKANVLVVDNIEVESNLEYIVEGVSVEHILSTDLENKRKGRILVGVYNPSTKVKLVSYFEKQHSFNREDYSSLIYPSSELASTVTKSYGIFIGPRTVVAPYAQLGNFVTLNRGVTVGHHSRLDDYVTVNPGANIAGCCTIRKGVMIGMGANILDGIEIGENTTIGSGSLVTKSIPANSVAYGVPAKVINSK